MSLHCLSFFTKATSVFEFITQYSLHECQVCGQVILQNTQVQENACYCVLKPSYSFHWRINAWSLQSKHLRRWQIERKENRDKIQRRTSYWNLVGIRIMDEDLLKGRENVEFQSATGNRYLVSITIPDCFFIETFFQPHCLYCFIM